MGSLRVTNWLLLGVFVVLLAHLLGIGQGAVPPAHAQPYTALSRADQCVTDRPNDKPTSYLHVVTHNFAGD